MYKAEQELRNQFNSIERTRVYVLEQKETIKTFFAGAKSICILGCGSSYCIAKSSALQFTKWTGLPAYAIAAGDLLVNCDAYEKMLEGATLVLLSRSGSTSEILMAAEQCRKKSPGIKIASICAVEKAPVAELADLNIQIPWAFDNSVCQTQTVSNLYAAALMLCGICGGDDALLEAFATLTAQAPEFCAAVEEDITRLGEADWNNAVVLADAGVAGLAEEAALAFKEVCQRPSNFYHVLDVRHGPMVLIDKSTLGVVFVSSGEANLQVDLVNELAQRSHSLLVLPAVGVQGVSEEAVYMALPHTGYDDVSAIFMLYCIQLLCLKHALFLGVNPDEPKDLDSWICLEH